MAGVINTSNWAKALWPGVNSWYGKAYDEWKPIHPLLFTKHTSKRAWEEDVGVSGFGLAGVLTEGGPISYDTESQAFTTRYQHVKYGLGFVITKEVYDDDQYDIVGKRRSESLAFSMRQTKEIVGSNVYNRAFNSAYVGGDGVSLLNAAHPNKAGGTRSNLLAVAGDISEATLEQACIDISLFKNDRGLQITAMPQKIIIHPNEQFEVHRILESSLRPFTANNDANALKDMGKFPGGVIVNPYLTDTDAWFIMTNVPHGMKYFERRADDFEMTNDFDTENAKFKAVGRYSFGWTDFLGLYGSPGA